MQIQITLNVNYIYLSLIYPSVKKVLQRTSFG